MYRGIVQLFLKVSFLQPLAPTQSEPPFLIAQTLGLLVFVYLTLSRHPQVSSEAGSDLRSSPHGVTAIPVIPAGRQVGAGICGPFAPW